MNPKLVKRMNRERRMGQLKSAVIVGMLCLYIVARYASSFGNLHNWSSKATGPTAPVVHLDSNTQHDERSLHRN